MKICNKPYFGLLQKLQLPLIMRLLLSVFVYSLYLVSCEPEQISLTYGQDPTQMVVSFALNSTDTDGIILWGTDPKVLRYKVIATGSTYAIDNYTSPMLYKGLITGLNSGNSKYWYKVGTQTDGYSTVRSFKSHPGVGVPNVTLHFIGDPGQTVNSVNTFHEILECENDLTTLSGGIVSMGDLSYANGDEPLWDSFANMKQFVSAEIPMMTTIGNHEWLDERSHLFSAYKARYNNPTVKGVMELYYSYDIGLAHIVMVAGYCTDMTNVFTQPCLAQGTPEMDWLQADLAAVDRSLTPWVFVIFHQPYVNSNYKHNMKTEGVLMLETPLRSLDIVTFFVFCRICCFLCFLLFILL